MMLNEELRIAKGVIIEAGNRIVSIYREGFDVQFKEDETPVTYADLESDRIILSGLKQAFPNHSFLTEESEEDPSRLKNAWCWIIDPLDGTKEFVKKNDEFTINIALSYEGRIVLGVVYAPIFKELYYAIEGEGAFVEHLDGLGENMNPRKIRVSSRMNQLKVLKSRSHNASKYNCLIEANVDKIQSITRMGSSLKGCRIALGEYDVYYNYGKTMLWDTAPVDLIVREAGGYFAQSDGSPIHYGSQDLTNRKGFIILNNVENLFKIGNCEHVK